MSGTSGTGVPPAAQSALTLRAWLAAAALVGCIAGTIATAVAGGPIVLVVLFALVGLSALIDTVVIAARRRQAPREPLE
jgi:F0F1-type ATP synthase assembly protein I